MGTTPPPGVAPATGTHCGSTSKHAERRVALRQTWARKGA